MYARIQLTPNRPDGSSGRPQLMDILADHPGFRGAAFCSQPDGPSGALVTFWATEDDAAAASARTEAAVGHPRPVELVYDEIFEVSSRDDGDASGPVAAAVLVFFDGPRDQAQLEADARSSDRIRPRVQEVPGSIVSFGMTRPDGGWVVASFATSLAALAAQEQVAMSTRLQPDEDPALMTGPDRILHYTVVAADIPARQEV